MRVGAERSEIFASFGNLKVSMSAYGKEPSEGEPFPCWQARPIGQNIKTLKSIA